MELEGLREKLVHKKSSAKQALCDHATQKSYVQICIDVVNEFEITLVRCINCHKVRLLQAKKLKTD